MLYNNKRRQQEGYAENISISVECNVAGGKELYSPLRASLRVVTTTRR